MTTLTIEQGNNIEIVSYNVILKLYETALNSTNVTLSGNLQCDHCFENAYDYLTGYVTEGVKRFPDLAINVTDGKYVSFADPEVLNAFGTYWGDGNGVTVAQMATHDKLHFEDTPYHVINPFRGNTNITSFNELGRFTSIVKMDYQFFDGATNLTSIDLSNIQELGMQVFFNTSLTGVINLPSFIKFTDRNTFTNCKKITEVNFGQNFTGFTGGGHFLGCSNLAKVTGLDTITSIPNNIFLSCSNLSSIDIDWSKITAIGGSAFKDCSSLEINNLPIPLLTTLGGSAFQSTKVKTVSDLGSITKFDGNTFAYCTLLTSITLPNTLTSIGLECFRGCTSLTSITLPNRVTELGAQCFRDSGLQSIDLSNVTTFKGNQPFLNCSNLTSVTLPRIQEFGYSDTNNVWHTISGLFQSAGLTSVTIPKEVEILSDGMFSGCSNLLTVTFESGTSLTELKPNVFHQSGLSSITIPEGVTTIGYGVFAGMGNVRYIEIPSTVTTIGNTVFHNSNTAGYTLSIVVKATTPPTGGSSLGTIKGTCYIYVPDASVNDYKATSPWSAYSSNIKGISLLPLS